MTREEKQKAIDALKISTPITALTPNEFDDYIKTLNNLMDWLEQEPCEDCINREDVLDKIKEVCFSNEQKWVDFRISQGSNGQRDFIIKFIESLPSVIPQSKTGHWIEGQTDDPNIHNILCSHCIEGYPSKGHANSRYTREKFKFCPNCGCRMERSE